MIDAIPYERREPVVSCYISGLEMLEVMNRRRTEDPTRSPHNNSSQSVCSTRDCVFVFDAGCWRRTSHRMTMACRAM
jgi:hypothetical protein